MWGLWLWMRLNAVLPLALSLAIHRLIGKVLYRLLPKLRRVVRRNIEICFPDLDAAAVEALAKRHFEALGMSIAECAAGWFGSNRRGRFEIIGLEYLTAAIALGRGVILYTGHFTALEILGQPFREFAPRFAAMASHRSSPLLEAIQTRGRLRMAHEMISSASVRSLIKCLKRGFVIWYAPDLAYPDGVLLPFFNVPAMTNTATSKIARMSGATVLPFSYRRLERGARYELHFFPPLEDFPSDDPVEDTRRLTPYLEQFIRACPEQYHWMQKRFRWRPPELPDLYANPPRS